MGCSQSSAKGEAYSNPNAHQETSKIPNNLTLQLQQLEKKGQGRPKVSKIKEIMKIGAEKKMK